MEEPSGNGRVPGVRDGLVSCMHIGRSRNLATAQGTRRTSDLSALRKLSLFCRTLRCSTSFAESAAIWTVAGAAGSLQGSVHLRSGGAWGARPSSRSLAVTSLTPPASGPRSTSPPPSAHQHGRALLHLMTFRPVSDVCMRESGLRCLTRRRWPEASADAPGTGTHAICM